jgi:hypothetical protein
MVTNLLDRLDSSIQNIDESKLVVLAGNTRPEATLANDRGAELKGDFRNPDQENHEEVRIIDIG